MKARPLYHGHPDFHVLGVGDAIRDILDEAREFYDDPCADEFSDVIYGINRLVGALFGMKYIRLIPLDSKHIRKCNARFITYGHFRSKRHIT